MTDTPNWMMKAAEDFISLYLPKWKYPIGGHTHREIAAIIGRHCPDDKSAEKLVEAAKHMVEIAVEDSPDNDQRGFLESPDYWLDGIENLEAAITEYEANK